MAHRPGIEPGKAGFGGPPAPSARCMEHAARIELVGTRFAGERNLPGCFGVRSGRPGTRTLSATYGATRLAGALLVQPDAFQMEPPLGIEPRPRPYQGRTQSTNASEASVPEAGFEPARCSGSKPDGSASSPTRDRDASGTRARRTLPGRAGASRFVTPGSTGPENRTPPARL